MPFPTMAINHRIYGLTLPPRLLGLTAMLGGVLVLVLAVAAFALAELGRATGFEITDLLRDPNAVSGAPAWTGVVSTIGVLLWSGTAAILLFAMVLLRGGGAPEMRLIRFAAALTLVFALDDALMLHEEVLPALGIWEKVVYLAYAVFGIMTLVRAWTLLHQGVGLFFLLALSLLAGSMVVDAVPHALLTAADLVTPAAILEDLLKLAGISLWAAFFFVFASRTCRGVAPAAIS